MLVSGDDDDASFASTGVCLNARASIVGKQLGADPNLPGPGQYIEPIARPGSYLAGSVQGVKFSQGPRTYNDVNERENKQRPAPGT